MKFLSSRTTKGITRGYFGEDKGWPMILATGCNICCFNSGPVTTTGI